MILGPTSGPVAEPGSRRAPPAGRCWASPQTRLDLVETYRQAGIDLFVIDAPRAERLGAM
jgi:hypothetical protein